MLKECIEVFEHEMSAKEGKLVTDSHMPADGTYVIVDRDGNIVTITDVIKDKKTKQIDSSIPYLDQIRLFDYYSILVSMNKPVDSKKIIHSNNYLSFAVKKDSIKTGKLTDTIIDGYYDILSDPSTNKYSKSKEASRIYQVFEEEEGKPDLEKINLHRKWIKEHIFALENVNMDQKDYLKIYFESDLSEYQRENRRYLLPNIYNSNDYNISVNGKIFGIPDNNLGMNAKKPFLSVKTRKNPASYLLDRNDVIVQKEFFDYLMNLVSNGKYNIYVDTEMQRIRGYSNGEAPDRVKSGYYFRISKGKNEAEILDQEIICDYKQDLNKEFIFHNYLHRDSEKAKEYLEKYKSYNNRLQIGKLLDEIFFSKYLSGNYTVDAGEINVKDSELRQNILMARQNLFNWIFKGIDNGISNTIQKTAFNSIKSAALKNYTELTLCRFNLMWSFREYFSEKGEPDMGEIVNELKTNVENKVKSDCVIAIDSDDEYYFCVGQLAKYLISLSKAKDKTHALLKPMLSAKTDKVLKKKILQLYNKYAYAISNKYKRTEKLFAMVLGYEPESRVDQEKIILGYVCDSVIFTNSEKEN